MATRKLAADMRKDARLRRLGPDAACATCGETTPEALVRGRRRLVEAHHVAGVANDPKLVVALCRNHHAIEQEALRDAAIPLTPEPARPAFETVALVLRSVAAFIGSLAESLLGWAERLEVEVSRLDAKLPRWREVALGEVE